MTARDRLLQAVMALPLTPALPLGERHVAVELLLPVVEQISAERAAEELRAARAPMLELADQIEAGAFSLDAERRGFLASAVRACAGGRPGEPCR